MTEEVLLQCFNRLQLPRAYVADEHLLGVRWNVHVLQVPLAFESQVAHGAKVQLSHRLLKNNCFKFRDIAMLELKFYNKTISSKILQSFRDRVFKLNNEIETTGPKRELCWCKRA
jgi:hypothetical protein